VDSVFACIAWIWGDRLKHRTKLQGQNPEKYIPARAPVQQRKPRYLIAYESRPNSLLIKASRSVAAPKQPQTDQPVLYPRYVRAW